MSALAALFDEFDADSSGTIDEEEAWRIVRRLGVQVGGRAGLRKLLEADGLCEVQCDPEGNCRCEVEFDAFWRLLQAS